MASNQPKESESSRQPGRSGPSLQPEPSATTVLRPVTMQSEAFKVASITPAENPPTTNPPTTSDAPPRSRRRRRGPGSGLGWWIGGWCIAGMAWLGFPAVVLAADVDPPAAMTVSPADNPSESQHQSDIDRQRDQTEIDRQQHAAAAEQLRACMRRIVHGPAYDASMRQTVWSTDREVIGAGSIVIGGQSSGRYRMEMTMHDGLAKHTMIQISDGRLAWTRTQIGDSISLRRVDVSRLDTWVRDNNARLANAVLASGPGDPTGDGFTPGQCVGGLMEMMTNLTDHHQLSIASAQLAGSPVAVITAKLDADGRERLRQRSGATKLSALQPTQTRVVIAGQDDIKTGFGRGLPTRFEFWSDPIEVNDQDQPGEKQRRMISLLELHSLRQIETPDSTEFRYEHRDSQIEFVNETDRYLQRYGVRLTEAQRAQLRR